MKDVNDYSIFTLAGLKFLHIQTSGKYEGGNARLNLFGALHLLKAFLPRLAETLLNAGCTSESTNITCYIFRCCLGPSAEEFIRQMSYYRTVPAKPV